jgi:hypothetical protein
MAHGSWAIVTLYRPWVMGKKSLKARGNEQWKEAISETEKMFSDSFVSVDAVPGVEVTRNEPIPVVSQLQTDEEEEMMRRVLRHLDNPQKGDSGQGWQLANQSLEAQVAQVIAGNINTIGSDTGDDNFLAGVMNATRLWFPLPSLMYEIDFIPP